MSKGLASILILVMAISSLSLIIVKPAFAQPVSTPSVPEFTLNYVVENKTIEVRIQNNIGASYYSLRFKGHSADNWNYYPYNGPNDHNLMDWFSVPFNASNSGDTALAFVPSWFVQTIPLGEEVDVQVQDLFGEYEVIPYGHVIDVGGPTYDFVFKGTASEFSSTQTITISESSQTPSPSVPEFPITLTLVAVLAAVSLLLVGKKKLKPTSSELPKN